MTRAPVLLFALGILSGAACDLVVPEGETIVLGDGGFVSAVNAPNAVVVRPGATLVVDGSEIVGRDAFVELSDTVRPGVLGSAVTSEGGLVQVRAGRLAGGRAFTIPDDPDTPPNPPPPGGGLFPVELLPPALVATDSVVEIDGGSLTSGSFPVPRSGTVIFFPLPALSMTGGELRVRGGVLQRGIPSPFATFGPSPAGAASVRQARVAISGGAFDGWLRLTSSRSRISGGRVTMLALGPLDRTPAAAGCTEIHGGTLALASITSPDETLLIFGTSFSQPLGRVPIASVSDFRLSDVPSASITGVLALGQAFRLDVFAETLSANVVLASPGDPGCPDQ